MENKNLQWGVVWIFSVTAHIILVLLVTDSIESRYQDIFMCYSHLLKTGSLYNAIRGI